jgi:LacI family transcriptional regulator
MLDNHPEVTAVVAPQEIAVAGLLRAVQERGLRIPGDLSVVATLGEMPSQLATPPFTSIAIPAEEMGSVAARILLDRLASGGSNAEQAWIRSALTVRGSTAAPRKAARPHGTTRSRMILNRPA